MLKRTGHTRYAYSPIVERRAYSWPGGICLYVALNIEHFAFGAGLGMDPSNRENDQHFVVATVSGLSSSDPYS
jgi:hypothetical protein